MLEKMRAIHLVAGTAILVVLGALAALVIGSARPAREAAAEPEGVRVVSGNASSLQDLPRPPSPVIAPVGTTGPKQLAAAIMTKFPMIREADVVCENRCRLIAALGVQEGPSPFAGNLERFLVDQGYTVDGDLVVDRPGDNDTLLTIPVILPGNARNHGHPAGPEQTR